jgi:hypothetical protein
MNNYQRTKERNAKRVEDVTSKLEAFLVKHKLAEDVEALAILEEYRTALATATVAVKSNFSELFAAIGDTISKMDAFSKTDGRVCIDARQLYQWRRKGLVVEETAKGSGIYKYTKYDAAKAEEYRKEQAAKRAAKASA